tara:strand:- start:158 stop:1486 length:1329 start_codon:yes stop_codon:yes gene_type:complete
MSKSNFFGGLIKTNPTIPTANSGANYGVASGVWNLEEAAAFREAGDWPIPASAPTAPNINSVTAGVEQVTVAFSATGDGGLNITSFTATASSGETASGSSSPLTVTGLAAGTAVTFTVTATNVVGTSPASSASSSIAPNAAARGLFMGGYSSASDNVIQYITIPSTGNATDFGDLSHNNYFSATCSSDTRAISAGGLATGGDYDQIEYVTIASTGNAADFGNLSKSSRVYAAGAANSTRGMFLGGYNANTGGAESVSEYITISSLGNGTDFSNSTGQSYYKAAVASPTRVVVGTGTSFSKTLVYHTISTAGDGFDFGNLVGGDSTYGKNEYTGCNSNVRGLFALGRKSSTYYKDIDYITIASTGNGTDFGDLTNGYIYSAATASNLRGVFAGGYNASNTSGTNVMEYVTFASTGNGTDFGDLLGAKYGMGQGVAGSDHGGLQ